MDWEVRIRLVLKMWTLTISILMAVEFMGADEIILRQYMG